MILEKWKEDEKWFQEGAASRDGDGDAAIYEAGWKTGQASRDVEVAELKVISDHNLATYHQAAQLLRAERDQLRKDVMILQGGVLAVNCLINDSSGVVGLHLNGDIAEWDSLRTGGQFESWLIEFDEALAATEELK